METTTNSGLVAYARFWDAISRNLLPCPDCCSEGPHEDNGCEGEHLAFLCRDCGAQFDVLERLRDMQEGREANR